MGCRISVIVPNRNGEKTIGLCLEALFRSAHDSFEVIVVDDASADHSVSIIERFPCRLVRMEVHAGAAAARNAGASHGRGELLFFTDADCLVQEETLARAERSAREMGAETVIGGTYTLRPYDDLSFYSMFQSVFIHYCELKKRGRPDYVAAHAMVIGAEAFERSGGFPALPLPIIEDVAFSHRLRGLGYRLVMDPALQVRHIFGFRGLLDSMRNGFRKSQFWTMYSLENRDLLADSGTASFELKLNVACLFASLVLLVLALVRQSAFIAFLPLLLILSNIYVNRNLFSLFHSAGQGMFLVAAAVYYMFIYPFAVGAGALVGVVRHIFLFGRKTRESP